MVVLPEKDTRRAGGAGHRLYWISPRLPATFARRPRHLFAYAYRIYLLHPARHLSRRNLDVPGGAGDRQAARVLAGHGIKPQSNHQTLVEISRLLVRSGLDERRRT